MGNQKTELTRRRFVATSLGALAGASVASLPGASALAQEDRTEKKGSTEPVVRTLGRTGIKLPIVSMGAGACNDPGLVISCYEAGMRHFDTATSYGNGRNEQMVGSALNKLGVRDKVIIGTKVHKAEQRRNLTPEQSSKRLISSLDASLKRLGTDYVDILYVHSVGDTETVKDEAIIDALKTLKAQGKVRFTGISTHSNMAKVCKATTETEFYDVFLTSFNFTLASDAEFMSAIQAAAKKGIGIVAMKTQAGGSNFPDPDTLREYDGAVINSAALKWAMHNEYITTAITGISNYEHMRMNFAIAGNLEYTDEEKKFLSDSKITLSMGFCHQCQTCLASCPEGVEVPDLMRTHMYTKQYADFGLARQTMADLEKGRGLDQCTSCSECIASCAHTVDIKQRIEELKLVYC